ncbi:uncharacterized protein LOC118757467, partial [Rhagoletis pomonella]|uniref:uncharacterized protein LOC118757467 n=1 Tax=Rhagoletis pomonella TaxID=28610 RepID=UPI00178110B2
MRIVAFGDKNTHRQPTDFKSVQLNIKGQYSGKTKTITAIVVPKICIDVLPVPKIRSEKLKYLKLELADTNISGENLVDGINLLIGQDHFWQFTTTESKRISERLVAVKTLFGWTIQGCSSNLAVDSCVLNISDSVGHAFDISNFWRLESVGITNFQSNEDQSVVGKIRLSINRTNGRYVVNLPWRIGSGALADNKQVALSRLRSLTTGLLKHSDKLYEYDAGIRELLQNGFAEAVDGTTSNGKIYYMPHRPVYREEKITTKMRIVFDASSSEVGLSSLNEHLSVGDNLVANLLSTLIKFRSNPIALTADIEKAFLQISLAESDRDCHRFFWYESTPKVNSVLPSITEYRMARVTFGVASSPFLLAATIQTHIESCRDQYGVICDKLKASFYVDDLVLSLPNRKSADDLFQMANSIMGAANFNLRKWNTNDILLKASFPVAKRDECTKPKVLGINWCTIADELSVELAGIVEYLRSLRGTKRN